MHADSPNETSNFSRRDHHQLQSLQHLNNNYCSLFGIAPQAKETTALLTSSTQTSRNSHEADHMLCLVPTVTLQKLGSIFYSP